MSPWMEMEQIMTFVRVQKAFSHGLWWVIGHFNVLFFDPVVVWFLPFIASCQVMWIFLLGQCKTTFLLRLRRSVEREALMSVLKRKQCVKFLQSDPAGVPTGGFRSAYQIEFPSQGRWGNLRACSGICDVLSSIVLLPEKVQSIAEWNSR